MCSKQVSLDTKEAIKNPSFKGKKENIPWLKRKATKRQFNRKLLRQRKILKQKQEPVWTIAFTRVCNYHSIALFACYSCRQKAIQSLCLKCSVNWHKNKVVYSILKASKHSVLSCSGWYYIWGIECRNLTMKSGIWQRYLSMVNYIIMAIAKRSMKLFQL